MRQLMRRAVLAVAILGLIAATAGRASAGTVVQFSYYGTGGPDNAGLISTGTGSFTFTDGLTTVGKSDLTSFSFDLQENTPLDVTFGLADLTSFFATVGPSLTLASLALDTRAVEGSDPTTYPREFTISSLDPPDAETHFVVLGIPIFWTSGTVTVTGISAPEPSSFTLAVLGLGGLIVAGGWARLRKGRATA